MLKYAAYGTELTPKSKALLISLGSVMLCFGLFVSIVAVFVSLWLAIPTAFAIIVGIYLIVWAERGKALWSGIRRKATYL